MPHDADALERFAAQLSRNEYNLAKLKTDNSYMPELGREIRAELIQEIEDWNTLLKLATEND